MAKSKASLASRFLLVPTPESGPSKQSSPSCKRVPMDLLKDVPPRMQRPLPANAAVDQALLEQIDKLALRLPASLAETGGSARQGWLLGQIELLGVHLPVQRDLVGFGIPDLVCPYR
jgi:hypothetical protein